MKKLYFIFIIFLVSILLCPLGINSEVIWKEDSNELDPDVNYVIIRNPGRLYFIKYIIDHIKYIEFVDEKYKIPFKNKLESLVKNHNKKNYRGTIEKIKNDILKDVENYILKNNKKQLVRDLLNLTIAIIEKDIVILYIDPEFITMLHDVFVLDAEPSNVCAYEKLIHISFDGTGMNNCDYAKGGVILPE